MTYNERYRGNNRERPKIKIKLTEYVELKKSKGKHVK